MSKKFAIISAVVMVWAAGSASAHAFEQNSAPTQPAPVIAPDAPALSMDEKAREQTPEKSGKGIKLPWVGKVTVPKLNFGLDLMYGTPETKDTDLGFSSDSSGEDDVTIMGKVKRRF